MTEEKKKNNKQGRGEGKDYTPDQWCNSSKMWIKGFREFENNQLINFVK